MSTPQTTTTHTRRGAATRTAKARKATTARSAAKLQVVKDTEAQATAALTATLAELTAAPASLDWGTAKAHGLAVGDTLWYGGQSRKQQEAARRATVVQLDAAGVAITTEDGSRGLHGGVATRFYAQRIAPEAQADTIARHNKAIEAKAAKAQPTEAPRTFDTAGLDTYTCRTCGQTKPVRTYPTTTGPERRGTECRACRNARRDARKAQAQ